ncbi:MAG TPA: FIST N-terminal domain-containing protein [Solirubrobacteraceae bacterium]|nr:FIST N-terminal domain-containing protein [Solirubrobacteraceae bacterium]
MTGSAVTAACAMSTALNAGRGAAEAAGSVRRALGTSPDLAVVFAAGAHLSDPAISLAAVHEALAPAALIGCGAAGVLGPGREVEAGTAISVWAATLGDGGARPFHADVTGDGEEGVLIGLPDCPPDASLIMLADPFSFPTDGVLDGLARIAPAVPVLGGLASGRTPDGAAALMIGDEVRDRGAVGVVLEDVAMVPCVSQGAAPLGREMTITAADGNVIRELAGRPAVEALEEAIAELGTADRALLAGGLLVGIVIDSGQPEYTQGDFLVRGVLGADASSGAVAVAAQVQPGQVVRLHARDAHLASEDLRGALALRAEAIGGAPAAGALVFACSGRGRQMFGTADHDATSVQAGLGTPAAGFFAAGEIGPVGGRSFLHTYTATVAVFAA